MGVRFFEGSTPSTKEASHVSKRKSSQATGANVKALPSRSEVRDKMPPSTLPRSTPDMILETPSRKLKRVFRGLPEVMGMDVVEEVIKYQGWNNIREDIINRDGQNF